MIDKSEMEMADDFERFQVMTAARSKVGLPCRWGGNGPLSFDCSGYVCWCLRHTKRFSVNIMPDLSANGLANDYFRGCKTEEVKQACIMCYGDVPEKIDHVMLVNWVFTGGLFNLIGARGCRPGTNTIADAFIHGAFVSTAAGDYWKARLQFMVDPWKKEAANA